MSRECATHFIIKFCEKGFKLDKKCGIILLYDLIGGVDESDFSY